MYLELILVNCKENRERSLDCASISIGLAMPTRLVHIKVDRKHITPERSRAIQAIHIRSFGLQKRNRQSLDIRR